jgi:hypothetical protein
MAKPSADKTWSDITLTLISSDRVYRNGRQQVLVEAAIRITSQEIPDEHGNPSDVPLTADELASIRLVTHRGDELPEEWKISRVRGPYDGFPGLLGGEKPRQRDEDPDALKIHYVDMYVATTAAAGQGLKMALAITRDDKKVFISNGETDLVPDAEITLLPERIPDFPIANFGFEKSRVQGVDGSELFIDNYYIGLTDNANQALPLRDITSTPAGMIQWARKAQGETFASYSGYGKPGATVAHYNTAINYGAHKPSSVVISPKQNFATVLLVGRNDISYHSDSANQQAGPCDLTVTDLYGNEHALRVRFKEAGTPQGRFDLVLEKR